MQLNKSSHSFDIKKLFLSILLAAQLKFFHAFFIDHNSFAGSLRCADAIFQKKLGKH